MQGGTWNFERNDITVTSTGTVLYCTTGMRYWSRNHSAATGYPAASKKINLIFQRDHMISCCIGHAGGYWEFRSDDYHHLPPYCRGLG